MSPSFQRAIIVGASSGIGEALARKLAAEGCMVALVARRESELQRIAQSINAQRGIDIASSWPHDARRIDEVPALFERIVQNLGGIDLFVYASGIMPRYAPDEYDTSKDSDTIAVNFTGAVAWLNQAAVRFGVCRSGTIVGISSVAGDRGRRGNAVYGATKAAMNAYLESLYVRLAPKGARVVTIKPGPIATAMTEGLRMPFKIPADQAAAEILQAARHGTRIAYVPAKWRGIMRVIRFLPAPIYRRLPL